MKTVRRLLYREVLVLRFHEDLSLEEISKVTKSPLSTVKSRLYRGLAAIKPKLGSAATCGGANFGVVRSTMADAEPRAI